VEDNSEPSALGCEAAGVKLETDGTAAVEEPVKADDPMGADEKTAAVATAACKAGCCCAMGVGDVRDGMPTGGAEADVKLLTPKAACTAGEFVTAATAAFSAAAFSASAFAASAFAASAFAASL
jgi:hypothetical protein